MLVRALGFSLIAVIALIVLAAIGIFAKMLALFLTLLLAVMLVPLIIVGIAWIRIRVKNRADVERSRGSILKHIWEEQHHREW